ncbi:formate dehydrogenase accessory sulfurtransferase FdhD [Chloroflexota bacterium]
MKRFSQPYRRDEKGPAGIMPWRIWRLTEKGEDLVDGGVVVEEPLEIRLDGRMAAVVMRTPGMEKELAAGFVLGEGLVADLMDIALVRHCGRAMPDGASGEVAEGDPLDESRNRVDVTLMPGSHGTAGQPDVVQLIRSGCGRTDVGALVENLPPVHADVKIPRERLPGLLGQITRQQAAYRAAGGIHAAAVFDISGRCLVVCEDIGRHNAVDKAAGYCLLRGIPLRDKLLVSTGRASYDMVAKGVRLGIPFVASISSPTSLAVELAEALNCTLLGYLRGKAFNVYTHGWRLLPSENA